MLSRDSDLESKVYEYLAFLISSARRLFEEPIYGPLRLLDAARRFLNIVVTYRLITDERVLSDLRELMKKIDEGIIKLWRDTEKLKNFTSELNVKLAEKISELMTKG